MAVSNHDATLVSTKSTHHAHGRNYIGDFVGHLRGIDAERAQPIQLRQDKRFRSLTARRSGRIGAKSTQPPSIWAKLAATHLRGETMLARFLINLREARTCAKCGTQNNENNSQCIGCGTAL